MKKYGEDESISNKIQILDWGENIDAGCIFSFIVQGTYEVGETDEDTTDEEVDE